jgi:hypothetical protein
MFMDENVDRKSFRRLTGLAPAAQIAEQAFADALLQLRRAEAGDDYIAWSRIQAQTSAAEAIRLLFNRMTAAAFCPLRCADAIAHAECLPRHPAIPAPERIPQLSIFRDIFGNPFRPVAFDPAWRSESAVSLARMMYESRNFHVMPVLADALEEAGCDNADVLAHCREPNGVHVRGCWVVDLVLGKS